MPEERNAGTGGTSVEEALGWTGRKLDDVGGSTIGRVEGVYADAEDGSPAWLLFRVGRFGHHSLLPIAQAVGGEDTVWVPYEREMMRRAPRVDAGLPLGRERELELCDFYGIAKGTGRRAEAAARPEGTTTAHPAEPSS